MERSGPGSLRQVAATALPTSWGAFSALGFERPDLSRGRLETAIVLGGENDIRSQALEDPDLKPLWKQIRPEATTS